VAQLATLGGKRTPEMQKVTIIREHNCYDSNPTFVNRLRLRWRLASSVPCRIYLSVWLDFNRGTDTYTKTATRVIGPVPEKQAEPVIQQLEAAFKSAGFAVSIEDVADD
jgi:hypothetical protein